MNPNMPPMGAELAGEMPMPEAMPANYEQTLPVEALREPNDREELVTPAEGDEVSYQVTGRVVSVAGDRIVVQPTSVNGQEIAAASQEAPETGPMDLASLEAEAKGML